MTATQIALESPTVATLSAERSHLSPADNALRTNLLREHLIEAGGVFQPVKGIWKGVPENSFIVLRLTEFIVRQLARGFNQEAYIYSHQFVSLTPNKSARMFNRTRFFATQPEGVDHSIAADGTIFQFSF